MEARLEFIRLDDGLLAENEGKTLNHLMQVHLPGFQRIQTGREKEGWSQERKKADWNFAAKIVDI